MSFYPLKNYRACEKCLLLGFTLKILSRSDAAQELLLWQSVTYNKNLNHLMWNSSSSAIYSLPSSLALMNSSLKSEFLYILFTLHEPSLHLCSKLELLQKASRVWLMQCSIPTLQFPSKVDHFCTLLHVLPWLSTFVLELTDFSAF